MLEEDEVALALAEHYVVEVRRLLSDHLAKIARLKSEGKETSDTEETLGLVEAFLAVIERHIDFLLRFPSTISFYDNRSLANVVKDRGGQALTAGEEVTDL
jgi:hypothetical protein